MYVCMYVRMHACMHGRMHASMYNILSVCLSVCPSIACLPPFFKVFDACWMNSGDIGYKSCSTIEKLPDDIDFEIDLWAGACLENNATIGDLSCYEQGSCYSNNQEIGNSSCIGYFSCYINSGMIGNESWYVH